MSGLFPKAMNILSGIEGFHAAIVFNFRTNELLDYAEFNHVDLRQIVVVHAKTIRDYFLLLQDLPVYDVVERYLITTNHHYHITYLPPQFDNVAVYLIVNRYTWLPTITQAMEDAVFSMH